MTSKAANRLLLVDAYGILFRQYYGYLNAHRPPVRADGKHVGALLGFCKTILRLNKVFGPTHFAIAFDVPGGTFRHELYTQYKAHRPPVPDALKWQIKQLPRVTTALGIANVQHPGAEADDVIGTISAMAHADGNFETGLATYDKDYNQLINSSTFVVCPDQDLKSITEEEVLLKYGVPAANFSEFLALVGDAADNIPGCKGIGPKKAAWLLREYGSIERILEASRSTSFVAPKLAEKIQTGLSDIEMSLKLARIETNLHPFPYELSQLVFPGFNASLAEKVLLDYDLRSVLSELHRG